MKDFLIELVAVQHPTIQWGKMFYPAHEKDLAKFMHCTGCTPEYLFKGGVMSQKYIDLSMEVFAFHGLKPVIVDEFEGMWEFPRLQYTAPAQPQ